MRTTIELCEQVSRERDAVLAIGQPVSSDDVYECVKSLVAVRAFGVKQIGVENEDWQKVEEQYFYLLVETFGAAEETALSLSNKMAILTRELCEK